ncbi:MAG: hypothetical protein V4525_04225 [Pseudomonadota bacterium]
MIIKSQQIMGLLSLAIASFLVGCSTQPAPFDEVKKAKSQVSMPICNNDEDCNKKWNEAKIWVSRNAGYPIEKATDTLIETDSSKDKNLSIRVTKMPLGDNKYQLFAEITCANLKGCNPNAQDALLDFNSKISEGRI